MAREVIVLSNKIMVRKGFQTIEVETKNPQIIGWLKENSIHRSQDNLFKIEPYKIGELIDLARYLNVEVVSTFNLINKIKLVSKRRIKLRDYQEEAIKLLKENNYRGIIVLPTGAGKSYIGIKLLETLEVKTLIIVPTIDLLNQWKRKIIAELGLGEELIGIYGGDQREIREITIATYQSASKTEFLQKNMTEFSLLILDEVHHASGEIFMEIPRRLTAIYRAGFTATFDVKEEKKELLVDLIGKIFEIKSIEELASRGYLANYDYKLIKVELTRAEKERYRAFVKKYAEYLSIEGIKKKGKEAYMEVIKRSKRDECAREALEAIKQAKELSLMNRNKLIKLNELLNRHKNDKVIIFTRHVKTAGLISYLLGIPKISSDTLPRLREQILNEFRKGTITKIVTAEALDEGVDVPDASVCIIISGKPSKRQLIQRIGRVLRPKGNKKAIIYEIITSRTLEEKIHKKRHRGILY